MLDSGAKDLSGVESLAIVLEDSRDTNGVVEADSSGEKAKVTKPLECSMIWITIRRLILCKWSM
jgi:hypothetical protein